MEIASRNHTPDVISRPSRASPRPPKARKISPNEKASTADSDRGSLAVRKRSSAQPPQHAAANRTAAPPATAEAEPLRTMRIAATIAPEPNHTFRARARHNAIDTICIDMTARRSHAQSRSAPLLNGWRTAFRTVSTYRTVIATNQRRGKNLLAFKIRSWTADI